MNLKFKSILSYSILLLIFSCSAEKNTQDKSQPQGETELKKEQRQMSDQSEIRNMKGTVVYHEIEGGFWGIIADDGRKFNPINLDENFQEENLRVKFDARVKKGMVGIHMWGEYIEILKMEKLDEE